MATRGAFGFVWAMGLVLVLASWPALGFSASSDAVRLDGWADEGILLRGEGMGADLIQLFAEAEWQKSASRDPSKYAVRITLPGGGVQTRPFPVENPPGRRRFVVYLPASSLRNIGPSLARGTVTVVDSASGNAVSNALAFDVADLPRPRGDASAVDPGPFGWGKPLSGPARTLPGSGLDGFVFARVLTPGGGPGFFVARTEATIKQVSARLPGYDPKAGRSDEFVLEDPLQPAIALTPSKASDYLKALSLADPSGIAYRLPTRDEWKKAATAGESTAFWWGDDPKHPQGANFIGPEPALPVDTTAPSMPSESGLTFAANPFGLFHTFGNVAEWATEPNGGFIRVGGHFRTEPEAPLPDLSVARDDDLGPDPFVGVRPVFDLTSDSGAELVKKRLATEPSLAGVSVAYNPDTATVTLTGPVLDGSSRRLADRLLEGIGFVSYVENKIETPKLLPGQLASLGAPVAPVRRTGSLGRTFLEVPLAIRWFDPLPVSGSEWWVNVYLPGGGHLAHKLVEGEAGRSKKAMVAIDREKLASLGLGDRTPFHVALSLGAPASSPNDARVVTNSVEVRPATPTR